MRSLIALVAVAVCMVAVPDFAKAGDVYVNGKLAVGLTNGSYENCKVTFKPNGDIEIEIPGALIGVPGYQAAKQEPQAVSEGAVQPEAEPVPQGPPLENRYFVFSRSEKATKVPYNYDIFINGRLVAVYEGHFIGKVHEITKYLVAGVNNVEVKARFDAGAPAASGSHHELIFGQGGPVNGVLEIERMLERYETKSTDSGDKSHSFTIEAK